MKKLGSIILIVSCFLLTTCQSNSGSNEVALQDVTAELIDFIYTPDTGNNTSRLQYKVRFFNPNSQIVSGFYRITTNIDGTEATLLSNDESRCYLIDRNSECNFSFNEETPHSLGIPNSITFVSAEYTIEQ